MNQQEPHPASPSTALSAVDLLKEQKLSAEQKQKLALLKEKVSAIRGSLSPEQLREEETTSDVFLARHLIARKWDVDAALAMIQKVAEWRKSKNIDRTPLIPPLIAVRGYSLEELVALRGCGSRPTNSYLDLVAKHFRKVQAAAWHKHDKHFRPVFIERTGHLKAQKLVDRSNSLTLPGKNPAQHAIDLHVHSNEVGRLLCRYNSEKHKTPVAGFTVILDCEGLGLSALNSAALHILRAQSELDQQYYAEMLHRLYVINCTSATVAWNLVKYWMDERVQQKVQFVSTSETAKVLLEAIDADKLPKHLGGQCVCEGCCVPDVEDDDEENEDGQHHHHPYNGGPTKQIHVNSGESLTVEVPVPANMSLRYRMALQEHNIIFGARFQPVPAGSAPGIILRAASSEKTEGPIESTFTPPPGSKGGKVVFLFDNTFSWVRAKTVDFLAVLVPAAMAQQQQQSAKEQQHHQEGKASPVADVAKSAEAS